MGMTAAEKILARASGVPAARAGEILYPMADFAMIHDGVIMGAKQELDALGIDRLFDPERVLMVTDHDVVYQNERAVARGAFNRKAAQAWGVKHFYDAGYGGHGHIFPMERGLVLRELREGVSLEQVQKLTEPTLHVEGEIRKMEF